MFGRKPNKQAKVATKPPDKSSKSAEIEKGEKKDPRKDQGEIEEVIVPEPNPEKSAAELNLDIRPIRQEEAKAVVQLLVHEGVSCFLGDLEDWMEINPQCVWGAYLPKGNKLISCCMVMPLDEKNGHIGNFVTRQEFKWKGVGTIVYQRAARSLSGRNIFVSAADDMEVVFERWGYHFSRHAIYVSEGRPKLPIKYTPPTEIQIQPVDLENLYEVVSFDQSVSPIDREHVWPHFLKSPNTVCARCALIGGKVEGLVLLRKNGQNGMRISAFYAESNDVARALLYDIIKNFVPDGTQLSAWYSIVNIDRARLLYRDFGLDDPESMFRSMYTKEDSKVPWFKVYSIFEHYTWLV